ncbi:MAG: type II secretion system F family protein [Campylobacterales bacterium]|nr:type II secretion system F family protein [Campylobacterales bacterium]
MAEPATMSGYVVLALLSLFAAASLHWFAAEARHYSRLARLKNILSGGYEIDDDFLNRKTEHLRETRYEQKFKRILKLAGLELKLWQLHAIAAALSGMFGAAIYLFLQHWFGFLLGSVAGVSVLWMFLNAKVLRRKIEFNRSFMIAISVLVKMMRNGIGFEQALAKSVKASNSAMFRKLFERFLQEKNRIGEIEAFENMNREIDSKELRIFALAVKIGRESGGHFSSTLEKVEDTLRYRKKMQDKVSVITREANIGSYMVASLNVLLYFMIDVNFGGKVSEYFFTSEWGRWQLLAIGVWMIAGLMVNRWITRIEL